MNITVSDPHISKLANHVLEYMWNQHVGVVMATFAVITAEVEAGSMLSLFKEVSDTVFRFIEEQERSGRITEAQLRMDRSVSHTFLSSSAEALARLEESAPVIEIEQVSQAQEEELKVITLPDGQICLAFAA